MNTTVKFRDGFRLPQGVDAATAADRLLAIHEQHGNLTPEQVLADAKKKASPLHDFFEWDDSTAAHEHRKWQARHLLGSIMLTVERPGGEVINARQFLHVQVEATSKGNDDPTIAPRYMELNAVLSDDELRQQQIDMAMVELGKWAARWAMLDELDTCFRTIGRWRGQFGREELAA